MNKLFAVDGRLFNAFSKFGDMVLLNLLWIFCCIPIITIGASTTALYYVTLKMVRNEETYIAKSFLKSFKENFRQATTIWIGMIVVAALLYFDFYFSSHMPEEGARLLFIPFAIVALFFVMFACYIFPILSFFKNSLRKAIKNTILMAVAHLPYTILAVFISFGPWLLLLLLGQNLILATFLFMIVSVSFFAYINSLIFRKVFEKYIPEVGKIDET